MPNTCLRPLLFTALLTAQFPLWAGQDEAAALVERINAYREAPGQCEGRTAEPLEPLVADDRLARVEIAPGSDMRSAMRDVGYLASTMKMISASGPTNAARAMALIRGAHCAPLLDPQYSEIGVTHSNDRWQVVLAHPLLASELGDWEAAGRAVLEHVNEARAESRQCGAESFEATGPLQWNDQLASAAIEHSRDMAEREYFSHESPDGEHVSDRVALAGYEWLRLAENIASGVGSPEEAVSGWLASPQHCVNIMNPHFTDMGAAYALNPDSRATSYWTQVFAQPE